MLSAHGLREIQIEEVNQYDFQRSVISRKQLCLVEIAQGLKPVAFASFIGTTEVVP
jgi:hypothetical protein